MEPFDRAFFMEANIREGDYSRVNSWFTPNGYRVLVQMKEWFVSRFSEDMLERTNPSQLGLNTSFTPPLASPEMLPVLTDMKEDAFRSSA